MDTEQIKKAAKVAGGMAYYPPQPYEEDRRYSDAEIAWLEFVNQASPVVVSELIAENEQLKAELECARGDLKTAMEIVERNQKDADCFNYLAECKEWPDEICAIIDCGSPGAIRIAILDQIAKERT